MLVSLVLLLFCSFVAAFHLLNRHFRKWQGLPPGPIGVPLLGYLPFLDVFDMGGSFKKLSKKYGDIFSIKAGTQLAVILNTEESIKKVFANASMCNRPDTFMFRFFSRGEHGIASASGETWEVQRKFTHTSLKMLGFGKARLEQSVLEEVSTLIQNLELKSKARLPIDLGFDLNVAVANVMWTLISGEKRSQDDQFLHQFTKAVDKSIELASTSGILLFMPFLIKLLPEKLFGIPEMRKWIAQTDGQLQKIISDHKKRDQMDSVDFIDAFLQEMKKPDCHSSFTEFQLQVLCTELFGAGGEPTSVTLKWAIQFLANNPEVLRKAQDELDMVVGPDRQVSFNDRSALPYIQALVHEVIRLADIHPIGVVHSPNVDTKVNDYIIPKGSFVFPNFHKVLRDPDLWEEPNKLHPEHFLDSNGHFIGSKREGFISFGYGRRRCPGQDMALMEIFLFLSNLIHKFDFESPTGEVPKKVTGVVVRPEHCQVILTPRF